MITLKLLGTHHALNRESNAKIPFLPFFLCAFFRFLSFNSNQIQFDFNQFSESSLESHRSTNNSLWIYSHNEINIIRNKWNSTWFVSKLCNFLQIPKIPYGNIFVRKFPKAGQLFCQQFVVFVRRWFCKLNSKISTICDVNESITSVVFSFSRILFN